MAMCWAALLGGLGVFDLARARLAAELLAGDLRGCVRFGDLLLLAGEPRFERTGFHRPDGGDHARVAAPADERALTAVQPEFECLEPGAVVIARHGLDLRTEFRHPPFVHHVR